MTMLGARQSTRAGAFAPLRRLIAGAMARDLRALAVPGADVALAAELDLSRAGLIEADGPRQANVLLVMFPLPAAMLRAATVAYAQMPRPRAVLALGEGEIAPLPRADATGPLSQEGLEQAVAALRGAFTTGAFSEQVADFDAPLLQTRVEYTCPMHPEIVSDEPGKCPKCGMFLVEREVSDGETAGHEHHEHHEHHETPAAEMTQAAQAHHPGHTAQAGTITFTCPMHPEVTSDEPGNCPKCGMNLVPVENSELDTHKHGHHHDPSADTARYTCPMHPEVVSDGPGNCPKCGMNLVRAGGADAGHADQGQDHRHRHGGHQDHGAEDKAGWLERVEPGFMSMIGMTEGTPRSSDGLQMEWIDLPFGPIFPGLPGGLTLDFTLDGDTVAGARVGSAVAWDQSLPHDGLDPAAFAQTLGAQMRLAPVSYHLLACRALASAAGLARSPEQEKSEALALARERIADHLLWCAQLGRQLGLPRIESGSALQSREVRGAKPSAIVALDPALVALIARLRKTPFLARRLRGIGQLDDHCVWSGPGAADSDAADRLAARLDAMEADLATLDASGDAALPQVPDVAGASGSGHAMVETTRGPTHLNLELEAGRVTAFTLDTPTDRHLALVEKVADQAELADALVAVASLDLSPWEMRA